MNVSGQFADPMRAVCKWMFAIALCLVSVNPLWAAETILDFHSHVTVNRDGSLDVTERITVNAEGRNINRGIYRDLPTIYDHPEYGKFGFKSKAPITVIALERNGLSEPYHRQELSNGVRVFFGSQSRYLENGEHTYTFRYKAERQIGVNDDIAQLYWNVTGNGWSFPIEQASARVSFPGTPTIHQQEVYTGYQGSARSDAQFSMADNLDLTVEADRQLRPGEGMTVRVRFDSAEILLPNDSELIKLFRDNKLWFLGAGLLLLMALIFVVSWYRIGRDPQRGIVIAQYRPVEGLSAAAHRAVYLNRVDDTSFSVGILSAAIKGWLTISKPRKDTFRLTSTGGNYDAVSHDGKPLERLPLSPSEQMLVNDLFLRNDTKTLDGEYDSDLKQLKQRYDGFLQEDFAKKSHQDHRLPLGLGGFVGLVGLVLMAIIGLKGMDGLISLLIVLFIASSILLVIFLRKIDGAFGYSLAIISLILAAGCVYSANTLMAIAFSVYGVLLGLFMYLMPAPKWEAVHLLDQIEGFKLYLSKAEHDSLKRLDLPEKTPQLYEELLPFAIALDLETEWSEQFTDVLAAANWNTKDSSHHSSWYSGGSSSSMGSFAPAIAAGLASSVVAASTPPSSSSSSGGGGGFSGGGGGGGGGGGW